MPEEKGQAPKPIGKLMEKIAGELQILPSTPQVRRQLLVSFEFDDSGDFSDLIGKLNEIIHESFKTGPETSGSTLAALHYNLLQYSNLDRTKIGMSYLKKAVNSYLQNYTSPLQYAALFHSYSLNWFKLLIIFDFRAREWFSWLDESKAPVEIVDHEQFLARAHLMLPSLNPEGPAPPFDIIDYEAIQDLVRGANHDPYKIGMELSRFYSLLLKRIMYEKETLEYLLSVQLVIGKSLFSLGNKVGGAIFNGCGEYYSDINRSMRKSVEDIVGKLNDNNEAYLRRQWTTYNKFSGTKLSDIVKRKGKTS
ncbi:MAG TPA: hypothetical protein VJ044_02755 [Candidatus Hodarchaeales archaeon]|nr:hypothetical protein [Candidatus Hodarchaeales archaeon]